ncbi:MAG: cupin domain-containing protein [Pseudomonadota bacterium]
MKTASIRDIPEQTGASHPVTAADKCRARRKQRLGDAVGLDQFGVNRVTIDAGVSSTVRHWHSHEDEFVLVLEGELTLVTDAGERTLKEGDMAGFKAGIADGHRLENRSEAKAVYLEVGSRRTTVDTVTYPDDDLVVRPDATGRQMYHRADGTLIGPAD